MREITASEWAELLDSAKAQHHTVVALFSAGW